MLNRIGAVSPRETPDRHITKVSAQCKVKGLLKDLDSHTFTVATTDNIDFLQSDASVYVGNQSRSWHGMGVQVVQPVIDATSMSVSPSRPVRTIAVSTAPGNSTSHIREPLIECTQPLPGRHRPRTSPINNPSMQCHSHAHKHTKHARTFVQAVGTEEISE